MRAGRGRFRGLPIFLCADTGNQRHMIRSHHLCATRTPFETMEQYTRSAGQKEARSARHACARVALQLASPKAVHPCKPKARIGRKIIWCKICYGYIAHYCGREVKQCNLTHTAKGRQSSHQGYRLFQDSIPTTQITHRSIEKIIRVSSMEQL